MVRLNDLKKMPERTIRLAWLGILLAVWVVYSNSFQNGFHFDDFHTVTDNPAIRSLKNVPRFFTDATTFSVLPPNRTYRPFVSASLALDYALGRGYKPFWFHLSTFLVYLVQLAFMYLLFRALLTRVCEGVEVAALLAVAWYGVHPAMAETLNYVIQRGDVYSTCGVAAAMALFASKPKMRRSGLYLLPFAVGLMSKPPAIVLPALVFAYMVLFEGEEGGRWRRAALAAVPSAVCGGLLMALQSAMTPKTYAPSEVPTFDYILTQPFVLLRYFGSFFLPIHLNVDTDLVAFHGMTANALWGILFLGVMAFAIWITARRRVLRPICFGLLWFVIASIPTSVYRLSETENDHRMFMPFVGLVLAVTWSLSLAVESWDALQRRWVMPVVVVLLCAYGYGAHRRNEVWRTEESLWLDDVQKSPKNGRGLMIYGLTQMNKGAYPAALASFEGALKYTPNYPTLEINLGVVNGAMRDGAGAERHFLRAIALAPNDDQTHFFYGRWLMEIGRPGDALPELRSAERLNPNRLATRDLLLHALTVAGDLPSAEALARRTVELAPDDLAAQAFLRNPPAVSADTWVNISLVRYQQRDYAGCIAAVEEALKLNPRSEIAYNNEGAAYAAMGRLPEAIAAEKKAIALQPDFQLAKNNLVAYARSSQAGVSASAGTSVSTSGGKSPEQLVNESLALYESKQFAPSVAAARAAVKMRPEFAEAWNNIAAGEAAMQHWDEAIAAATRAIQLRADFQLAKNNLAWATAEKAKKDAATR